MLTIPGRPTSSQDFCDGVSRRDILRIGTLAAMGTLGGWTLPDVLRAESISGRKSPKSVIMIYLVGGPPHQDMFDLKPDAPREIAGPWRPIATKVPGFEICEAFPRLATMADRLTVIRSLVGNQHDHDAIQVFNGHDPKKAKPSGGWPQFGTMVSKVQGPARRESPRICAARRPRGSRRRRAAGSARRACRRRPCRPASYRRQRARRSSPMAAAPSRRSAWRIAL